jgi:signal transduction histidine kinase
MRGGNDIELTVVFTTFIIVLLIFGVAITIFIAYRMRVSNEMKMAQMQLKYEKELRTVQNEVQEQVLNNVGRDLHDNIGQLLSFMNVQIENKKVLMPESASSFDPLQEVLGKVINEVRFLGRSLNSDVIEDDGLLKTIQADITRLKQLSHFELEWVNDETEPPLNTDQRLMAFRIFQEMVNNSLKHSEAEHMRVSFTGKDLFILVVEDDGIGFDPAEKLRSSTGSGLRNIIKRAGLANLTCNIDSAPGKGCIFTLKQLTVSPS